MLTGEDVETLNDTIQGMDRTTVANELRSFQARFPIDFTPEFYEREPLGRLRHILFGLCLHKKQMLSEAPMARAS